MRALLLLTLVDCAAQPARACLGPDVGFVMQSYTYLARLRCIDGRDVAKANRVSSLVGKNGCYEDHTLIKCVDDPKWTELVFVQQDELPAPPLGFRLISESGYIQYNSGMQAYQRGEYALAALAFDSATASDPDIALLHHVKGMSLMRMGRPQDARRALQRAVSLAPGALSYRMELAAALAACNDAGAYDVLKSIERDATADFTRLPELWCQLSRTEPDAKTASVYRARACGAGFAACC